jgi:hypothetical protein
MRTIILALAMAAPGLCADTPRCESVGGSISTNFLDQSSTMGVATGSLRGAVGVDIKGVSPGISAGSLVFHNHHRWVTSSGDTIFFSDADATANPAPDIPGVYAASYKAGVQIVGGTGKFSGATGTLQMFGGVNNNTGQIVLRYSGRVCYSPNE